MVDDILKLSDREQKLVINIYQIFNNHKSDSKITSESISIIDIKNYLLSMGIKATYEEIYKCIQYLYVIKGVLIKDTFYGLENKYALLQDRYYHKSSYQEHYNTFEILKDVKKIILISDTHIGNEKYEDFEKLTKIYEYAKQIGIDFIFHLGDLFDKNRNSENLNANYLEQIKSFNENYPKDVLTYFILGNHDNNIHTHFQDRISDSFDLRGLSIYNPLFQVFTNNVISVDISEQKFHFAHRMFLNHFHDAIKMLELSDMSKYTGLDDAQYNVHISGHLHEGFFYSKDDSSNNQSLYIGVPALIRENDNVIAIQIDFNYFDKHLSHLSINSLKLINKQIISNHEFNWYFKERNEMIRKLLKK